MPVWEEVRKVLDLLITQGQHELQLWGKTWKGSNNVYSKLNQSLGRQLIGIGCGAHIVYNAIKPAADCLPVDFECIILKIYSFFYIYSVRVEALKEFCDSSETEYHKMLGYSKTRWLALMPALERVIKMSQPLKNYFLSIDKCPNILKTFFENSTSELWLYFLHAQAATFHEAVLKIEVQNVSALESAMEINRLRDNLALKENTIFLPHIVRNRP
ncbi:putative calcium channel voltage-dependent alpha2/delta subunit 1 [Danaus plexippus plexippus]|uniref:Calcium channel voltage-dependent alpha2/delta subunit 1 n=1 Tax=Danaus plexippus plexippus TaxID=278856 RepID=A0A212EUF4_DANPL|nr:putative calcium channel voltage-dependent alpha2/delta subunit 1 [Danaus plexippus plexippus]